MIFNAILNLFIYFFENYAEETKPLIQRKIFRERERERERVREREREREREGESLSLKIIFP